MTFRTTPLRRVSFDESRSSVGAVANLSGSSTLKTDPTPTVDITLRVPPRAFAKFMLMTSPRPTPSWLRFLFYMILVKGLKSECTWVSVMPTPVSSTFISIVC